MAVKQSLVAALLFNQVELLLADSAAHQKDAVGMLHERLRLCGFGTLIYHAVLLKPQPLFHKHLMHAVAVVVILRIIKRARSDKYDALADCQFFAKPFRNLFRKMMVREPAEYSQKFFSHRNFSF